MTRQGFAVGLDGDMLTASAIDDVGRGRVVDSGEAGEELMALLELHGRPLYRFLLGRLRNREQALDCIQDTFLRAHENLCRGQPVNASWLYTVARHRAVDEFRYRRRLASEVDVVAPLTVERDLVVSEALSQLPTTDQEVLWLFVIEGLSTDEIGELLGVQGSAVRARLHRARKRFRSLYEA